MDDSKLKRGVTSEYRSLYCFKKFVLFICSTQRQFEVILLVTKSVSELDFLLPSEFYSNYYAERLCLAPFNIAQHSAVVGL